MVITFWFLDKPRRIIICFSFLANIELIILELWANGTHR